MYGILFGLEGLWEAFLDQFSTRLCYACHRASSDFANKFFCEACYKSLRVDFRETRKYLGYDFFELTEILHHLDPITLPKIFYVIKYNDKSKKLVRDFKYRKPYLKKFCADQISAYLIENLSKILSESDFDLEIDSEINSEIPGEIDLYFVSVPLHKSRQQKRTYNQAELLAQSTAKRLRKFLATNQLLVNYQSTIGLGKYKIVRSVFVPNLFCRRKKTPALFNKTKQERLEILDSAFCFDQEVKIPYNPNRQSILIVLDDISTTGATFLNLFNLDICKKLKFDEVVFLAYSGRNLY